MRRDVIFFFYVICHSLVHRPRSRYVNRTGRKFLSPSTNRQGSHVYPRRPQIFENMRILSRAVTVVAIGVAAHGRRSKGEDLLSTDSSEEDHRERGILRNNRDDSYRAPWTAAECAIQNPGSVARELTMGRRGSLSRSRQASYVFACALSRSVFHSIASQFRSRNRYRFRSTRTTSSSVPHVVHHRRSSNVFQRTRRIRTNPRR